MESKSTFLQALTRASRGVKLDLASGACPNVDVIPKDGEDRCDHLDVAASASPRFTR